MIFGNITVWGEAPAEQWMASCHKHLERSQEALHHAAPCAVRTPLPPRPAPAAHPTLRPSQGGWGDPRWMERLGEAAIGTGRDGVEVLGSGGGTYLNLPWQCWHWSPTQPG